LEKVEASDKFSNRKKVAKPYQLSPILKKGHGGRIIKGGKKNGKKKTGALGPAKKS